MRWWRDLPIVCQSGIQTMTCRTHGHEGQKTADKLVTFKRTFFKNDPQNVWEYKSSLRLKSNISSEKSRVVQHRMQIFYFISVTLNRNAWTILWAIKPKIITLFSRSGSKAMKKKKNYQIYVKSAERGRVVKAFLLLKPPENYIFNQTLWTFNRQGYPDGGFFGVESTWRVEWDV